MQTIGLIDDAVLIENLLDVPEVQIPVVAKNSGLLIKIEEIKQKFTDPGVVEEPCAGLAELGPDDTLESLLHRVDAALYEAKNGGRDRLCVAGE